MLFLVFISGYATHRDLHALTHPFSTLRSSDLQGRSRRTGPCLSLDDFARVGAVLSGAGRFRRARADRDPDRVRGEMGRSRGARPDFRLHGPALHAQLLRLAFPQRARRIPQTDLAVADAARARRPEEGRMGTGWVSTGK